MSMLDNILAAVTNQVTSLNLAVGSDTLPVVELKTNRAEPSIDAVPQIVVCKAERNEDCEPFAFGPAVATLHKTYYVEITIDAAGNADQSADSIPLYGTWRESIISLFKPGKSSVPVNGVWDVDVLPDDFLPRDKLADNWDKMTVVLAVHTYE